MTPLPVPLKVLVPPIAGALIVVLVTELLLARPVLKFEWFDPERQSIDVHQIDWEKGKCIKSYEVHASLKATSWTGKRALRHMLKHQAEFSIGFENGKEILATVESASPGSLAQSHGGKVRARLSDQEDNGYAWIRVTFEIQGERSLKRSERDINYHWKAPGSKIHEKFINIKRGPNSALI